MKRFLCQMPVRQMPQVGAGFAVLLKGLMEYAPSPCGGTGFVRNLHTPHLRWALGSLKRRRYDRST